MFISIVFYEIILFKPILFSETHTFTCSMKLFSILFEFFPNKFLKIAFLLSLILSSIIIYANLIIIIISKSKSNKKILKAPIFGLLIGKDDNNSDVFVPENSLYQNFLIIGSIGSGKTSSAMYPFTKQLINYKSYDYNQKLSFLILDVKGNYYEKVVDFASSCNRLNDVIVIDLSGKVKYNPLNKPNLKSSVLANRLKTILLLFSPNNSESYWLDKVEQILECSIDFCRIYNDNYVTFNEIHSIVNDYSFFNSKIDGLRKDFINGKFSKEQCYLLYHSIDFLKSDYFSLDSRTFNILKSEITRITNVFISDFNVNNVFCPKKNEQTFYGFDDVLKNGKIVVLNMNIAEYKNLSKIIAAYLKLDFQSDVLKQLSNANSNLRSSVFISDEYQEYVTSSDANFFSQSREAKCINIVSTQSYTSIINTLGNLNSAKVIIQNLVNKLWFRTDDIFTIEDIQKQIGKEEKEKTSRTLSENSKESNYSYFSKEFISVDSNISESINSYYQNDFVYDYNYFTQKLKTFNCVAFLSDGTSIIKPQHLKMIPYFLSDEKNNYKNKKTN